MNVSRRQMQAAGLSLLGAAFWSQSVSGREAAAPQAATLAEWVVKLQENAKSLGDRRISALQWQEVMDLIYGSVPLASLKKHLHFQELSQEIIQKIPESRQELFHRVDLTGPGTEAFSASKEPRQSLITKVAYIKKGESVPPHGHSNMVSAFLCLSGEFDVELYDRLEEREDSMVIRHSKSEKNAGPGTWSSISDYRDNVHWLTAKTDDCFLFTCKLLGVEPNRELNGRIHLDVRNGESLGSETINAAKITYERAQELY